MIASLIILLSIFASATGEATTLTKMKKSVSAGIDDTNVNGLSGLNLKLAIPFQIEDYIVGIRHKLGGEKALPDEIFVKKSMKTSIGGLGITEGDVTIDATFKAKDNIIGASIKWISDKLGATIFVDGDSADNLKNVEFETSRNIQGKDVNLFGGYNFLSKKASGKLSFQVDDSLVSMSYDNKNEDPKISFSQKLNDNDCITPTLSLKSKQLTWGWSRKVKNGLIETTLVPNDHVLIDWNDKTSDGTWRSQVKIPIKDRSGTSVSLSRKWDIE